MWSSTWACPKRQVMTVFLMNPFQFFNGLFVLVGIGRLVMPFESVLHEGDPLPLDRVGDDRLWALLRQAKDLLDLAQIVTIHLVGLPAEASPPLSHVALIDHLVRPAETLELVVVHDGR